MKQFVFFVLLSFLLLGGCFVPFARIGAGSFSPPPVGSCFSSPSNLTITTEVYWANLSCTHVGSITISGSGSLVMVNSSLAETGLIYANETSALRTSGSSIDLISSTTPSGIQTSGLASVFLNSTKVSFPVNATVLIYGETFYSYNSTFSLTNSSQQYPARFQANLTSFLSSQLVASQVTGLYIGNLTSINSVTRLESSSISDSGSNINESVRMFGSSSLNLVGSTIENQGASFLAAQSLIFMGGGLININQTQIISSEREFVGYTNNASSILSATAASNLNIVQSKLISGETAQLGVYESSGLSLVSNANIAIVGSLIQSEAQLVAVNVNAIVPPLALHDIFLNQSLVETGQSAGSVSFAAGFGLILNNTKVDVLPGTLSLSIYELFALNSNITSPLTFSGGRIQAAYLYNFSATSLTVLTSAIFFEYNWVFVHAESSSGAPAPNTSVNVVNALTNEIAESAETNSSGWARIPLLQREMVSGVPATFPIYVIEASGSSSTRSNQESAFSNETTYLTMPLYSAQAGNTNYSELNYFPYSLLFGLAAPQSSVSLYTNSYPLNFYNNVSYSELDFSTVGSPGYTFSFTFEYPKNMSISSLQIKVDGVPLKASSVTSNSTYYFVSFSIPSGYHKVSLTYIPPIITPNNPLPFNYTGLAIILGVAGAIVLVVAFMLITVKKRENPKWRKKTNPQAPSGSDPFAKE